jgi:hypothetical protein
VSQTVATWVTLFLGISAIAVALAGIVLFKNHILKLLAVAGVFLAAAIVVAIVGSLGPSTDEPPPPPPPTTTNPPPTSPPPASRTTPPASQSSEPAPPEVFLDEIAGQWIKGPTNYKAGSYVVNGATYPRSLDFPAQCGQYPEIIDFVLSRRFSKFTAVVGLADDSGPNAKVRFEITADGSPVGAKYDVTVGEHKDVHLDQNRNGAGDP